MSAPRNLPSEVQYWNTVANEKRFSHPLCLEWLKRHVDSQAWILDFGCGYGRTVGELLHAGYENTIGVDFSFRMLARCRSEFPDLRLAQNSGQTIPIRSQSVNLVLLFAVLTCIPRDEDQLAAIKCSIMPGLTTLTARHRSLEIERASSHNATEGGTLLRICCPKTLFRRVSQPHDL